MKKITILALLVVLAAIVVACATPTPTPAPKPTEPPKPTVAPTKAPEPTKVPEPTKPPEATKPPEPTKPPATARLKCDRPIRVGLITDKSGPLAAYGAMIERSFLLGWEWLAGAPGKDNVFKVEDCEFQILIADDKGVVDTTATVARELIEVKKVDLLVGTVSSGGTATLQGIARDNKKVLIVAPAASNDITGKDFNEYTFRVSRNNYQDAINLCQYLTTQYKKFAQIAPDYSFGYGGAAAFRDACTVMGGTFVINDVFAPLDTKEFTPYLDKIMKSGAEAWIVTWAGAGFVPMFKTAQEMGLFDKMKLAASLADNATIPLYAAALGQNSGILYHYTAPKNKINDWLVEQTKARHKVPPDLFDADGMNAAIAVVTALRKTNGNTDSAALIKAMEGMEFDGPKGKVYFRPEDHVAIQDMYIVKILNVTDKEFKYFETVKTNRPEPPCLLPESLKARCGKLPYMKLGK